MQKQRIEDQISQVRALIAGKTKPAAAPVAAAAPKAAEKHKKRKLSKAARERIAEAQKKRWAVFREKQESEIK